MNWLLWLLIGIVLGWLVEFIIDYLFWQRRSDDLSSQLSRIQKHIGELEAKAAAAEKNAESFGMKLSEAEGSLDKAHADLTGAHKIQETLRKNIQTLEDRVDNWGRKIGLLAGAKGALSSLGAAFSEDGDDDLKQQIDALHAKLNAGQISASSPVAVVMTRDPLHEINGIGAVYEQRLNEAGITTFAQLVTSGALRLREIIAPKDWQAIDTEDWIAQAQLMMNKELAK